MRIDETNQPRPAGAAVEPRTKRESPAPSSPPPAVLRVSTPRVVAAPTAEPAAPSTRPITDHDLAEAYRAWESAGKAFRRYRSRPAYEKAVAALCAPLWRLYDARAVVSAWLDPDRRWADRALAKALPKVARLDADRRDLCLAVACARRLQEIQRQMAGLP